MEKNISNVEEFDLEELKIAEDNVYDDEPEEQEKLYAEDYISQLGKLSQDESVIEEGLDNNIEIEEITDENSNQEGLDIENYISPLGELSQDESVIEEVSKEEEQAHLAEEVSKEEEIVSGLTLGEILSDNLKSEQEEAAAPSEEDLLAETNKDTLDLKKEEKKPSIFKKALNKIKNVVCHPVKSLKKAVVTIAKIGVLPFVGIGYFVMHPINSIKNIASVVRHPVATYNKIKNSNNKEKNSLVETNKEKLDVKKEEKKPSIFKNMFNKNKDYEYTNLSILEGNAIIINNKIYEKDEYQQQRDSSKTNQEETLIANKSALEEINKNISDLTKLSNPKSDDEDLTELSNLEADENLEDGIEVVSDRMLQEENTSIYNIDKANSKYTNASIDASIIDVNNGSLKLYETPAKMFETNNQSTYENQNDKTYVKTKLSYM